jgi:hypothetical protein
MSAPKGPKGPLAEAAELGPGASPPGATKSPMWEADNALRYLRQEMIRKIQGSRRRLICYVAGADAEVAPEDTVGFAELLHSVPPGTELDLLLHTNGGDIDTSEKLMAMVRSRAGTASVRVIVPDAAKSAGTLMAIGADKIVMSDSSELGPIDPQFPLNDGLGNVIHHSVLTYLEVYAEHAAALRRNPQDEVARIMLNKLDPATVRKFELVKKRAREVAEKHLRRWMFRTQQGNFTQIAAELMDTSRWPSHGQMVGWEDAVNLGLVVEYIPSHEQEWDALWRLYCSQRLAVGDRLKLFESDHICYAVDSVRSVPGGRRRSSRRTGRPLGT